MKIDRKLEIGELYKDLRTARGLTLGDVVSEGLTVSQLSKFERGQSMLSADRLLIAITGLNMSFAEFAMAMNNYEIDEFTQIDSQLSQMRANNDIDGLFSLLPQVRDKLTLPINEFMHYVLVVAALRGTTVCEQLSQSELERFTNYFYSIDNWTGYEVSIFGNTVEVFEVHDLIFLSNHFWKQGQKFLQLPSYRVLMKRTLITLISTLIRRGEEEHSLFFIRKLDSILDYKDVLELSMIRMFTLLIDYKQGQDENREALEVFFKGLEVIGATDLSRYMREKIEHLL